MTSIKTQPLPEASFLKPYENKGFVDCFTCSVPRTINLATYIQAFYSSPAFWAERQGLKLMKFHPGSRAQIAALAAGDVDVFSAWRVEQRSDTQILLCDVKEQTRSWLMAEASEGGTKLYFGSAVLRQGSQIPGGFRLLMGFHAVYSKALLKSAVNGL